MGLRRNLRVARRATLGLLALPFLIGGAAFQATVMGPVFNNHKTIPQAFYNTLRRLMGIKVEFNKASAPIEEKRQTWYVANHQSIADFMVLGSTLDATFAGKGDIMRWPVVGALAKAVNYIGIRRVPKDHPDFQKFHGMTKGKMIKNFNDGRNAIMFPEGTTTDGAEIRLFRAGLLSILFAREGLDKQGSKVTLDKDVVVQPIGIKVVSVEGKKVEDNDELREFYSHYNSNKTLERILTRLATKEIRIELNASAPMQIENYADEKELANSACDLVREFVCPHQKEVKRAEIPNVDGPSRNDSANMSPPAPRQ